MVPMTVVGDDWLERYLVEWSLTAENAKGWIQNLKAVKSISRRDVLMPTDRVGRYGFKAPGWGIYLDLGGGKEAILSPDHPATLPDGTRGDRIRILTADGHAEKKAMVTPDGKVLIIHEEHIWPADAPPGTIKVGYSVASKEETREIMDAYKQYIPD